MKNLFKRILLVCVLICLLFQQICLPLAASEQTILMSFTNSKEIDEKMEKTEEPTDEARDTTKENEKDVTIEKTEETTDAEEDLEIQEEITEEKEEAKVEENKNTEEIMETKGKDEKIEYEQEETKEVQREIVEKNEKEEKKGKVEQTEKETETILQKANRSLGVSLFAENDFNMPQATYKTFILQGKNGKGQKIGNSGKVTMLPSRKEIQNNITTNHKEYISFTPHWGTNTSASLSTQSGSKNVSFYVNDPQKAEHVGGIGQANMSPNIIGGRVFQLDNSMKNTLTCTYSNVGRYYDRNSGKSYAIDLRAVLVNFTKKPKGTADVQKAVKDGVLGADGGALFCFTGRKSIGVLTAFCDSVTVRYDFVMHGTQTPISLKGFARFADIDAQQGIEFSSEADYFYAVSEANNYLGYSKDVYTAGNKAYIYALSSAAYDEDEGHTFYALFSGSKLTLRYTFAKCSRQDDGGTKNGSNLQDYKVPFDNSDTKHYSSSASRGYMHFDARQPYLAQPEISKSVFNGNDISADLRMPQNAVLNTLPEKDSVFTYKIRTVCPYEDASEHHYTSWVIKDQISPFLNVKQAVIYDGTGNISGDFDIQTMVQEDGSTLVTATARNPAAQSFYEKNWYDFYVVVQVKGKDELKKWNLSFAKQYRSSGNQMGRYVLGNKATVSVGTDYTSNEVETVVPQSIKIKKVNADGKPIQGITFGIFSSPDADVNKDVPFVTAVTNQEGIAHFKSVSFFSLAGRAGPYYIKEISRGKFENVYRLDKSWSYSFSCDEGNKIIYGSENEESVAVLSNVAKILKKLTVHVRKKNKETSDFLKGAEFALYQWSENAKSFVKLCTLEEKVDEEGKVEYHNVKEYEATEDNLGKFMIKEEQAPYGCYNAGKEWIFSTTDEYEEDEHNIEFLYTAENGTKKIQKGKLIYENKLQKGILHIEKTDETGKTVAGALFSIKAAEDIYAPWQYQEDGTVGKDQEPLVPKGTICETLTTDIEGKAVSSPLYIGTYQVIETGGAPDHVLSEEIYEVHLEYPETDEEKYVEKTVQVGNHTMQPAFSVAKISERTRNEDGKLVKFDVDTGRYIEKKMPGIYNAGETIRYKITVTNTGNVDLYQLRLFENLSEANEHGQKLEDVVDKEKASFIVPVTGNDQTEKGNKIELSLEQEDGKRLLLNKLEVGDCVNVFFDVPVLKDSANIYNLINKVTGTASYDNNEERPGQKLIPVDTEKLVDKEGNSLVEDEDKIHIPGVPGDTVIKTADRTTGCIVTDGELSGTKVPGIYYEKETVHFSIYVKNTGTANLKNIIVTDLLSKELLEVIDEKSASFRVEENGKMQTSQGEEITVRKLDNKRVILCENINVLTGEGCLRPGDVIVLYFSATIKKDAANFYDLKNTAIVNASYFSGEEDMPVVEIQDEDKIELPGIPEAKIAKIADRTTGAVLKEGRYQNEKVTGSYENGSQIVFTITVTNSGTADLYDLKVKDVMEDRLLEALEKDSITFKEGKYKTTKGNEIATKLESGTKLLLDYLKAGDSVNLFLYATVNKKAGDLFQLENKVYVTGHYRKGNESYQKEYETKSASSGILYQIQYHANNGTTERTTDSETPAHQNEKIHINGNPFMKNGYIFLGWNTKADGSGTDYAPGALFTMPAQDVHLYARWGTRKSILKKIYTYALTYHSNNPNAQQRPDSETRCAGGTSILLDENDFVYTGYHFLGWSLTPEKKTELLRPGDSFRMPKKDVHLYAIWEKEARVTLTYVSNIPGQEQKKIDFQTPCEENKEVVIKQCDFERDNYVFLGWSTNKDSQKPQIMVNDRYVLQKDTNLYAVWGKEADGENIWKYRLTYHGNNETEDSFIDYESPCEAGTSVVLSPNLFIYPGHHFVGWNTKADGTGKKWKENTIYEMPERNVHLYAQWEKSKNYTLTYLSNYPNKQEEEKEEQRIDSETPCLELQNITIDGCSFQCDGYVFLGWSLSSDGSTGILLPEVKWTIQQDTVLYAIWTDQYEEYTLLYSSNMDTVLWEAAPSSPAPIGTPHTLIENPFSHSGAAFAGWSLDPKASMDSPDLLSPGDVLEQPNKNIILYAIWKPETNYSLYYDGNGATATIKDVSQEATIKEEETPCISGEVIRINPSVFVREGYQFLGWSETKTQPLQIGKTLLEKESREEKVESWEQQLEQLHILYPGCAYKMPNKDITLYAVWGKEANENNTQELDQEKEMAESEYTPIPVTILMQDQDYIHIPGSSDLRIAKKADKTKGLKLKNGRYQGKREAGTYYQGDHVIYKITVSNYGTAAAYQVKITELPSEMWRKMLKSQGFSVMEGEILQTAKGNPIKIEKKTQNALWIDCLPAGDRFTVTFEAVVKEKEVKAVSLKNTVKVAGKKKDGSMIPKTSYMKDSEKIKIAKNLQKTEKNQIPKTGDDTPLGLFITLAGFSLSIVVIFAIRYRKKKQNR